ncbi:E3 ubiquitin-protein ligase TRIM7-like isoform 2-T2 [Sylvia borin]
MSVPGPAEQLRAEASCPVCLELFQEPVSIPCGHSFCRRCIERCWENSRGSFCCPRCRNAAPEPGLRPNRELRHVADIARGLLAAGPRCPRHREPLRLFCREERQLLCAECGRSGRHRRHRLLPAEEAAREYREEIQTRLRALKEEREKYLQSRKSGAERSLHLAGAAGDAGDESQGQRMALEFRESQREFQELQRFLEEQQRVLLARLGDLERDTGRARDEATAKVSEELSQLDTLMWEMEGKFQQPPSQFLRDIQQLLDSCEMMKFQPPAEISSELQRSLEDFAQRNILVRGTLRRCQDSLMFQLQEPADVTLDPGSAHRHLQLSEDGKEARGLLQPRHVPDHPGRFDFEPCVLARGGFTSGRHFWEVEETQKEEAAAPKKPRVINSGTEKRNRARNNPARDETRPREGAASPGTLPGTLRAPTPAPGAAPRGADPPPPATPGSLLASHLRPRLPSLLGGCKAGPSRAGSPGSAA